jgi:hypothetical protein
MIKKDYFETILKKIIAYEGDKKFEYKNEYLKPLSYNKLSLTSEYIIRKDNKKTLLYLIYIKDSKSTYKLAGCRYQEILKGSFLFDEL